MSAPPSVPPWRNQPHPPLPPPPGKRRWGLAAVPKPSSITDLSAHSAEACIAPPDKLSSGEHPAVALSSLPVVEHNYNAELIEKRSLTAEKQKSPTTPPYPPPRKARWGRAAVPKDSCITNLSAPSAKACTTRPDTFSSGEHSAVALSSLPVDDDNYNAELTEMTSLTAENRKSPTTPPYPPPGFVEAKENEDVISKPAPLTPPWRQKRLTPLPPPPPAKRRLGHAEVLKSSSITDRESGKCVTDCEAAEACSTPPDPSSSGKHPAVALSLLLLDEDNYSAELIDKKLLLEDDREPVDAEEKKYILETQNVDVIFEPEEIGTKASKWNMRNPKHTTNTSWTCTEVSSMCLTGHHRAVQTTLQRLTPRSLQQEEFTVHLIKTIRGKFCGAPDLIFDSASRKHLAFAFFDILLSSGPQTFVIGNFGFSATTVIQHAGEYDNAKENSLLQNLRVMMTPDQQLGCLYLKGLESKYKISIATSLPDRFLFLEIQEDQKDDSSGSHLAASNSGLKLITRHANFLRMLSKVNDVGTFSYVMLQPVVAGKTQRSACNDTDFINLEGPVDIYETACLLEMALDITREVRAHVGASGQHTSLSDQQTETAFKFLKEEIFAKRYMRNEELKAEFLAFQENPKKFKGPARKKNHQGVRNACKAWVHGLMGNTALVNAIIKHGLYDFKSQREFMLAFHELKNENRRDSHPTEGMSRERKLRLRETALTARRNLRLARNLAASEETLSRSQEKLVSQYITGELKDIVKKANVAYGHGLGAERMDTAEAVLMRVSGNELLEYFNAP